jgi:hypothetical protein
MGLLEIHFHDSEFVFRPSMSIGPSDEVAEEADSEVDSGDAEVETGSDELHFPMDEDASGGRRGALIALTVLVVIILGLRALRGDEED